MKYWKPRSLTFWASCAPIFAGVFLATEPLHGLSSISAVIDQMSGQMTPAMLINVGLAGIGLRAAV